MYRRIRERLKRPLPARSQSHPSYDQHTSSRELASTNDSFADIWAAALDEYRLAIQIDLRDASAPFVHSLQHCSTSDEVLHFIQDISSRLGNMRRGRKPSRAIRKALKPIIRNLHLILDATAETASSAGIPGGKGIFAAVAILIQAADHVSTTLDNMEKLLQRLHGYVKRLKVRVSIPLRSESREIAVMSLVKILKMLAALTRILKRGRVQHFLYALFSKADEVSSAFEGLERAELEEERMAIAELVVGVEDLSSSIHLMDVAITHVSQTLDEIQPMIERADATAQAILVANHTQNQVMADALQTLLDRTAALASANTLTHTSHIPETTLSDSGGVVKEQLESRRTHFTFTNLAFHLQKIVSRFCVEDQDLIWRAVVTLFSLIVESEGDNLGIAISGAFAVARVVRVAETTFRVVTTFLLLFMAWKLFSVSRPFGLSPDSIIIVDVLGEVFVLEPETFATWENTHKFLLQAFHGRLGLSYVQRREYGLGDSEHPLITPQSWPQLVRPGLRLHMSIIVSERTPQCPYCHTTRNGQEDKLDDGRIICAREDCGRPYGTYTSASAKAGVESTSIPTDEPVSNSSLPVIPGSFIEEVVSSPGDQDSSMISSSGLEMPQLGTDSVGYPTSSSPAEINATFEPRGQFQRIVVDTATHLQHVYRVDHHFGVSAQGRYSMNAGTLQGVVAGAHFSIYPSENVSNDIKPLAKMTATHVGVYSTVLADILTAGAARPTSSSLPSLCFARQTRLDRASTLYLYATPRDRLRVERHVISIGDSASVVLLNNDEDADLHIYDRDGRIELVFGSSVRKLASGLKLARSIQATARELYQPLRAASHFFWHLHSSPEDHRLRKEIKIDFHEVVRDNRELDRYLRPVWVRRGSNMIKNNKDGRSIDITVKDKGNALTAYGITVTSQFERPLHVWAFYFDCTDLSITDYYQPPTYGVSDEAPLLPWGKLLIGHGGSHNGRPFTYSIPSGRSKDVGFVKLFVLTKPFDLSHIEQSSPFRGRTRYAAPVPFPELGGEIWDTFLITVVQRSP